MSITTTPFVTSSSIARVLNRSVIQVRHVLATRDIAPMARAGMVRLYSPDVVDQVRAEIDAIKPRRRIQP